MPPSSAVNQTVLEASAERYAILRCSCARAPLGEQKPTSKVKITTRPIMPLTSSSLIQMRLRVEKKLGNWLDVVIIRRVAPYTRRREAPPIPDHPGGLARYSAGEFATSGCRAPRRSRHIRPETLPRRSCLQ